MGNAAIQGDLWGTQPRDWADLQEPLMLPLYAAVLDGCAPLPGARMLDVGCGSGLFCGVASERGLDPAGIDAAEPLLAIARERFPGIRFEEGDMESLPYPDASFDLVTGNNSFQYAADPVAALREARRVMNATGRLSIQVWGAAERCEMATYMAALGSVLPPCCHRLPLVRPVPLRCLFRERSRHSSSAPGWFPNALQMSMCCSILQMLRRQCAH